MRVLTVVFLFLALHAKSEERFIWDESLLFTEIEKEQIVAQAIKLKESTGIHFYLYTRSVSLDEIEKLGTEKRLVVELDTIRKEGKIVSSYKIPVYNKGYLQNLEYLYLNQGMNDKNIVQTLIWMMIDIEKTATNKRKESSLIKRLWEEEEGWSDEFWNIMILYLLLTIIPFFRLVSGILKGQNRVEFTESYGFSRLEFWQKIVFSIVVIGVLMVFINYYVFYLDELWTLYLVLLFTGRPIVFCCASVFMLGVDYYTYRKIKIKPNSRLSLGQKKFLVSNSEKIEDYILLDIYELLIAKVILITAEERVTRGRAKFYNHLSVNQSIISKDLSCFQKLIVDQFNDENEYMLPHTLVTGVVHDMGGFKKYRKDYLTKDLVSKGLMKGDHWVFNQFILTSEGETLRKEITQRILKVDSNIRDWMKSIEDLDYDLLTEELLLISKAEHRVERMYNNFIERESIHNVLNTSLSPIFSQSFSFSEYRAAIKKEASKEAGGAWGDDY